MVRKLLVFSALLLGYQTASAANAAAADVKASAAQTSTTATPTPSEADAKATVSPVDAAQAVIDLTVAGQNLMERLHNQLYQSYLDNKLAASPINTEIDNATDTVMPRGLVSLISSYLDIPTTILMSIPKPLLDEMTAFNARAAEKIRVMLKSNRDGYTHFNQLIVSPPFPFARTEKQRFLDAGVYWCIMPPCFYSMLRCDTCFGRDRYAPLYLFLNGRMKSNVSAIEPRDFHDYGRHDAAFRKQHDHQTTANNPFGTHMPPQESIEFKNYLLRHVDHAARLATENIDPQEKSIALLWSQFHVTYARDCNAGWWRVAQFCINYANQKLDKPYHPCF
jgi:hypothetical protein